MILDNVFDLIQEIKLKHVGQGAAALAGGALAAHSGLLGRDAEDIAQATKTSLEGIKPGFQLGQMSYDSVKGDAGSFIDRNVEGLKGAMKVSSGIYDSTRSAQHLVNQGLHGAVNTWKSVSESVIHTHVLNPLNTILTHHTTKELGMHGVGGLVGVGMDRVADKIERSLDDPNRLKKSMIGLNNVNP